MVHAPAVAAGLLVATFLCALPLALVLQAEIAAHLGASLEANQATWGWNGGWAAEFAQQSQGLGRTLTHEILGFGGTLSILSRFLDNQSLSWPLGGAVAVYFGVWTFLSGGIVDRLARGRRVGTAAFFGACGVYFFRFIRLTAIVGAVQLALFRWLHPYLLVTVYDRWTRDLTSEGRAIGLRLGLYASFLAALWIVGLISDYAKVRAVVEDRRSMIGSLAAAMRFIRRRFVRAVALGLLNLLALLVILRLWLQVAPSATTAPLFAFFIAQVYLLVRLWAKLAALTSAIVYFQGELAHAGYTAAPSVRWPDSPAAEGIPTAMRAG